LQEAAAGGVQLCAAHADQCERGSPGTGLRKYGIVVPIRLPKYTVRRSGPPKVTLAIHGASVPLQQAITSGVTVPAAKWRSKASEALTGGLVSGVYAAEELLSAARAIAAEIIEHA